MKTEVTNVSSRRKKLADKNISKFTGEKNDEIGMCASFLSRTTVFPKEIKIEWTSVALAPSNVRK